MRHGAIGGLVAAALVLLAAAPAQAQRASVDTRPVRPPGIDRPLSDERLSDERLITRWANTATRGPIRARPDSSARATGRLRLLTEDDRPEVYLVLESVRDAQGTSWLRIRVPGRPNGRTGWVLADRLGGLNVVRTKMRINRRTLRATLFRAGRKVWSSPIGIGKRGTPTPAGNFYVREVLRNLNGSPIYGPWAFGTSAYSVLSDWPGGGVVGLHGTNQPSLIPGRPSHGCVRIPNPAIRRLVTLMPIGTPIEIV